MVLQCVQCIWMQIHFFKYLSYIIYDTKVSKQVIFFRFPKDTVRMEEWINKIPTPNLRVSGKTMVCIKHFNDKDIKEVIYSNVEMVIQI